MRYPLSRAALAGALLAVTVPLAAPAVGRAQAVPLPPIGGGEGGPAGRGLTTLPAPKREPVPGEREPPALPMPRPHPGPLGTAHAYDLDGLTALTLQRNPRLAQGAFAIDSAAGRAVQAGLYPNPTVAVYQDEIADRTGPGGILTAPQIKQEIVTAGKLRLDRAAAEREVDQATFNLASLRYGRLAAVRQAYFEVLTLQRRLRILNDLFGLAEKTFETSERLLKAGQASRLDIVQLEVERERFRADREATQRELPAAFRRLAAAVGVSDLPEGPLAGSLDQAMPTYELTTAQRFVVESHPDIFAAKAGVKRAEFLLERARVEPIPNVTVQASYIRQYENRSRDFGLGVTVPVPAWNQNQGNIAASKARLGEAVQEVGRTENELVERLGQAYGPYASARRRAELYRSSILPRARESYDIALKAYQNGRFDYLRVLEAQRVYSQADLEYVRSLGEAWRAAAELSGLLLQENWPGCAPSLEIVPPSK
ncbi:MAG: TolC family protein [Gemmataceae bacterium]